MMHLAAAAFLALAQTNDKVQANSHDDAWEGAWKAHCQAVLAGATTAKTDGFVLQIGDSITYSMAYGSWIRSGTGGTVEDLAAITWFKGGTFPGGVDVTVKSGIYLAERDIVAGSRGMTAAGGIATDEYVSGAGNGGTTMPSTTTTATAQGYVTSGSYTGNLQITSVASAFPDAQFAVVMLGTNDFTAGRTAAAFIADLQTIVTTLENQHIAVILSTIPPRWNPASPSTVYDVTPYNTAIRNLAQSVGLPLIDYYAEILARRPGTSWQGTLLNSSDGIHPTAVNPSADPYNPGGNSTAHQTGTNCLNEGYLLRSWLTAQKLKEVQFYVILNNPVPAPAPPASGGGGGGGGCGLTGLEAFALLALLRAARKSGF
jgi:hypothetical protein